MRREHCAQLSGGAAYGNGLGLDLRGKQTAEHLHLEDFKFTDLKWAKSSRMSKRWLVFSLRIKVHTPTTPFCSPLLPPVNL